MPEKKTETAKCYILNAPAYIRRKLDLKAEKVKLSEASIFVKNNSYSELFAILKPGTKIVPLEEKKIGDNNWVRITDGWLLYR